MKKVLLSLAIVAVVSLAFLMNLVAEENSSSDVLISFTGVIIKPNFDICMNKDITDVLLHHDPEKQIIGTRLGAATPKAAKLLKKFEGKRTRVTVSGKWVESTECRYLSVYSVVVAQDNVPTHDSIK